jgi:hypothetical protein
MGGILQRISHLYFNSWQQHFNYFGKFRKQHPTLKFKSFSSKSRLISDKYMVLRINIEGSRKHLLDEDFSLTVKKKVKTKIA